MMDVVLVYAKNAEASIGALIRDVSANSDIVYVANDSTDKTAEIAAWMKAKIIDCTGLSESEAIQKSINQIDDANNICFLDTSYSGGKQFIKELFEKLKQGETDLVTGSEQLSENPRKAGFCERVALTLVNLFTGRRHTELGGYQAIRKECLTKIKTPQKGSDWKAEVQISFAKAKLKTKEIPYQPKDQTKSKIDCVTAVNLVLKAIF